MTTIAWDGYTLAADRAAWSGETHNAVCKVGRFELGGQRFLAAFAADAGYAVATMNWMRGGSHPGEYPGGNTAETLVIAIVIDESLQAWKLDNHLRYVPCEDKLVASGAGQFGAMCAMLAGANAVRAVEIVAKCSDVAADGVDYVSFSDFGQKNTRGKGPGKRAVKLPVGSVKRARPLPPGAFSRP